MKKVFRFKYNSVQDYIEKTNIVFFYIPFISRKGFTIPLPFFKFENNPILLQFLLQSLIDATGSNQITRYSNFEIEFSQVLNFKYNLDVNTDFLRFLGLVYKKPKEVMIKL